MLDVKEMSLSLRIPEMCGRIDSGDYIQKIWARGYHEVIKKGSRGYHEVITRLSRPV
jgi:hypothetical protein